MAIELDPWLGAVWRALDMRADADGVAKSSYRDLADLCRVTQGTVSSALGRLRDLGLVTTRQRGGRNRPTHWQMTRAAVTISAGRVAGDGEWTQSGSKGIGDPRAKEDELLGLIAGLAGAPCPQNRELAAALAVTPAQLDWLIARVVHDGRMRREVRGVRRVMTVAASGLGSGWSVAASKSGKDNPAVSAPVVRPEDQLPRVTRDRCPLCESPPHSALCRHGWNGMTTAAQRRLIAEQIGAELRTGVDRRAA